MKKVTRRGGTRGANATGQVRISTHPHNAQGNLTHITFRLQPLYGDDALPLDFMVPARRDGEIAAHALADAMRRMATLLEAMGLAGNP